MYSVLEVRTTWWTPRLILQESLHVEKMAKTRSKLPHLSFHCVHLRIIRECWTIRFNNWVAEGRLQRALECLCCPSRSSHHDVVRWLCGILSFSNCNQFLSKHGSISLNTTCFICLAMWWPVGTLPSGCVDVLRVVCRLYRTRLLEYRYNYDGVGYC